MTVTINGTTGIDTPGLNNSGPLAGTTGTFSGLISANGGQIKFPGTQIASADANTLDDYEEGTWTPTWAATSGSMTYAARIGTYTKIGRLVTVYAHVITTANNALSGQAYITGLPFVSSSASDYCVGPIHLEQANIQASLWAWGYVAPNSQTFFVRYWNNNTSAANLVGSQLNAGSDFMMSASYFV